MNTNAFILLKKFCCLFVLIISGFTYVNGQQKIPKNYIAASGIVEVNRLAVGAGLEYERWIYTRNQWALGGKVHYIFPSKTIDPIFSTNELLQRNTQLHVMATSYFFTNQDKEAKGFFLSFGAGINFIKWESENVDQNGNYYLASYSEVSPGFDFSLGPQFELSNRTALRFTGGYETFIGKKSHNEFVAGNGVALLYVKVSVGF